MKKLVSVLVVAVLVAGALSAGFVIGSDFGDEQPARLAPQQLANGGSPLAFQGVLKDAKGALVPDGARAVTFSIYSVAAGGTPLWQEVRKVITSDGVFSTLLGVGTPFRENLFTGNAETYLAVTLGGEAEMAPRLRLATVPYAINAEALGGLGPAFYLKADALNTVVSKTGDRMTGSLRIDTGFGRGGSLVASSEASGGDQFGGVAFFSNRSSGSDAAPAVSIANSNGGAKFPHGVLSVSNSGSGYIARFNKGFSVVASIDTAGNIETKGDVTVEGSIRVAGGAPGVGKVLTSDAKGFATWQQPDTNATNLGGRPRTTTP